MTDNLRGIIAVLIASTAFVINDAIVKLVSAELPSGEIIVVRGVLATALLAAGVVALGATRPLRVLMTRMMLMRLVAAGAATTFIVISLRYVPLATVNTVLQATPLLVTAGAAIFYGEKVGLSRWMAALTGFAGVLLIVKPGNAQMGTAAYVVLVALAFTTMRDLDNPRPAARYPLDLRCRRERCRHHACRLSGGTFRRRPGPCRRPGPGLVMGIGRLPVHRHTPSSLSLCARARSRWLRPFAMSPRRFPLRLAIGGGATCPTRWPFSASGWSSPRAFTRCIVRGMA